MKPSFALDLNHDGIGLVHRGKGGWQLVGRVGLDDPDLGLALSTLRDTAKALEPGALSTKLIVPGSQILFTSMTAPGPDSATREARIREGLEGLTPYQVDQLVFDWQEDSAEPGMVHVAVVARETLDEALGFAQEHGMNPVGFVARPNGTFSGEVYFGPVDAKDTGFKREKRPVPNLLDADAPSSDPVASDPVFDDAPADHGAAQPTDAARSAPSNDIPELAPFPPTPDEPDLPAAYDAPKRQPQPQAKETTSEPEELSAPEAVTEEPVLPEVGFSSRRSSESEPLKLSEELAVPPLAAPTPQTEARLSFGLPKAPSRIENGLDVAADAPAVPPASEAPTPDAKVHVPVTAPIAFDRQDAPEKPKANPAKESFAQVARKGAAGLTAVAERASALGRQAASKIPAPKPKDPATQDAPQQPPVTSRAAPALSSGWGDHIRSTPTATPDEAISHSPEVTAIAPPPGSAVAAAPKGSWSQEADALTVFGARKTQQVGGKPQFLGLYLFLGLLLFMAILVIWSMLFLKDTSASLDGEVDQFEAAITSAQPTPGEDIPFGADSTLVDPALVEGDEVLDTQSPDPLSEEAAQARYAATGIWQRAPEPLSEVSVGRIDDLYVASIDPSTLGHDAVALTPFGSEQLRGVAHNTSPPPPPGTVFDMDERGFVRATPDGALTPNGALVIAGRPPVIPAPAPRPERAEADTEIATGTEDAGTVATPTQPSVRPRARPTGLVESNERRVLGGRTRTELAKLRPRARPEAVLAAARAQAEAQAQAQADAIAAALSGENAAAAGIAPTALAVSRSSAPKARPKNFSKIVARARPNGGASDGSVAVAAASPRQTTTPKIPTRASVAKQATIKNAINLRKVSLIGIYGSASSRRALVRMPSGRYVKVGVGSRLDGGKVVSISTTKLIYQKGRRTVTLDVLPFS